MWRWVPAHPHAVKYAQVWGKNMHNVHGLSQKLYVHEPNAHTHSQTHTMIILISSILITLFIIMHMYYCYHYHTIPCVGLGMSLGMSLGMGMEAIQRTCNVQWIKSVVTCGACVLHAFPNLLKLHTPQRTCMVKQATTRMSRTHTQHSFI